jgi:large subunit ribosomal protein L14
MIYTETKLTVCDNSGAKIVKCLKLIPHSTKPARLGTQIVVSLSRLKSKKKSLEKKKLYNGLIIASALNTKRLDGSFLKFDNNNILLLDEKFTFLGTRVLAPICKEIRTKDKVINYKKIISYSKYTL